MSVILFCNVVLWQEVSGPITASCCGCIDLFTMCAIIDKSHSLKKKSPNLFLSLPVVGLRPSYLLVGSRESRLVGWLTQLTKLLLEPDTHGSGAPITAALTQPSLNSP